MFEPTTEQQKIIREIIIEEFNSLKSSFDKNVNVLVFEKEHFKYWILDAEYMYDVTTHKNVQGIKFDEVVNDFLEKNGRYENYYAFSKRSQYVLRFSKTYGKLEYYLYESKITATRYSKGNLIVRHKRTPIFSVRKNNVVLINGCRYLSFKNIGAIHYIKTEETKLLLLNTHLSSNFSMDVFKKTIKVSNKFSKKCSTIQDIVDNVAGQPIPKSLKSKFSSEALLVLYLFLDSSEINRFISFVKGNMDVYKTSENTAPNNLFNVPKCFNKNFYDDTGISKILGEYMLIKLGLAHKILVPEYGQSFFVTTKNSEDTVGLLVDYINMAYIEGCKININISSVKRLKFLHDQLAVLTRSKNIPKIKTSKIFPKGFESNYVSVELINDSKKLVEEGVSMNHCVSSYWPEINKGRSAIYKVTDLNTGERATLELGAHKQDVKNIYFKQLKCFWNTNPSKELVDKISQTIMAANLPIKMNLPLFNDNNDDLPF